MAVTSCPTVVPRDVCCWLPWRWLPWALPLFLWGGSCPFLQAHSWGRDLRDLPGGPFQAECVWSPMPQFPQGPPQTSVCGKESQPPTQTEGWGDCDRIWLCLTVTDGGSLTVQTLFLLAEAMLPHTYASSWNLCSLSPFIFWEASPILCPHGNYLP